MEKREDSLLSKLSAEILKRINANRLLNFGLSKDPIKLSKGLYVPDIAITFYNRPIALIDFKSWTSLISSTVVQDDILQLSNVFTFCPSCRKIYIVSRSKCYKLESNNIDAEQISLDNVLDDITILCLQIDKERDVDDSRLIAVKKNAEQRKSLERRLDDVQKSLLEERLKDDDSQDKDKIKSLEDSKKNLESQISSLTAFDDRHKQDREIESDWNQRIKDAFAFLKSSTIQIETEKKRSCQKWKVWIGVMALSTLLIGIWYCWLICKIEHYGLSFSQPYLNIAPYMIPVPIYIAILWIGIIQKGKARKIQLAIASLLFNVHYLESLLQLINRLSISSEVAVNNINDLIKEIIEQYIHQIGHKDLDLSLLDKIDKNENKDNPLIDKLTDIIKNITSHE